MRTVLITGGGRGIGKAIAEKFQSEGYKVVAPKREELNLSDNASIDNYIENNCNVVFDVIINNAGINPINLVEEMKDKDFDDTIQVNLKAPYKLVKGFVKGMKAQNYGRIVNISSIWGLVSKEGRLSYSATKSGINGITSTLAVELGENNILVNSVCPGYVATELTKQNVPEADAEKIKKLIPLGRFAEPEEIAEVVFFLASDKNTYITGQKIAIDGGYVAK